MAAFHVTWVHKVKNNLETESILKAKVIVNNIKASKLRWMGHVERMGEGNVQKKMLDPSLFEKR